ncbi:MAG: hypothetical protein WCJ30_05240, partial [Deltaproteobacteria bacterium]
MIAALRAHARAYVATLTTILCLGCGTPPSTDVAADASDATSERVDTTLPDTRDEGVDQPDVPIDAPIPPDVHRCMSFADCAGVPGATQCDFGSGLCVQCLPSDDTCPSDQHCDSPTRTCLPGCRTDLGCPSDGGILHCDVASHRCVECLGTPECLDGKVCVAGHCIVGCDTLRPCAAGVACCANTCADLQTSLAHCGTCSTTCATAHNTSTRTAGLCAIVACGAGFTNCDANAVTGCEVDTAADPANCGACGTACSAPNATPACLAGVCAVGTCNAGFGDCDGTAANGCETNTDSDSRHCGACATACAGAATSLGYCNAGTCAACASGSADCDRLATNGCEALLDGDIANCGACGHACLVPNATAECLAGACGIGACNTGFRDCNGIAADGCEAE